MNTGSSLLRVLCLHDAFSNAHELSYQLDELAERLLQKHGIELVFVNSPLLASQSHDIDNIFSSPPRVWWEEEIIFVPNQDNNCSLPCVRDDSTINDTSKTNTTNPKRHVGLDASLLLLRQVWTSTPYWGILAVGQAASVASLMTLMGDSNTLDHTSRQQQHQLQQHQLYPPSLAIFINGISLLQDSDLLQDTMPCLYIISDNTTTTLTKEMELLIRQFGGDVVLSTSKVMTCNRIGKWLVQQKKLLRSHLYHDEVRVLALQHQLHLVEQEAAQLVAQEIAHRPPKALMAVVSPKQVGGFAGGDRRRAPGEEGGGAPCPREFLLHRHKRSTPEGPTRQHPSQQQNQQEPLKWERAPTKENPFDTPNHLQSRSAENVAPQEFMITILLENPSKATNWGPLVRCCVAFGISRIYTVGYEQYAVQGSHGASKHIELVSFPTHQAAVNHLVHQEGFSLMGLLKGHVQAFEEDVNVNHTPTPVEVADVSTISVPDQRSNSTKIVRVMQQPKQQNHEKGKATTSRNPEQAFFLANRKSFPAHDRKFAKRTCLVVDKRSHGLSYSLAQYCSSFVHIPHYPGLDDNNNKPMLTMEACLSIILHEFTSWAKYNEFDYHGQKYNVEKVQRGGENVHIVERKRQERQARKNEMQTDGVWWEQGTSMFDVKSRSAVGDY
jgi:tRNA G18 (ribose-2'-O)-methylase SpoU